MGNYPLITSSTYMNLPAKAISQQAGNEKGIALESVEREKNIKQTTTCDIWPICSMASR